MNSEHIKVDKNEQLQKSKKCQPAQGFARFSQ